MRKFVAFLMLPFLFLNLSIFKINFNNKNINSDFYDQNNIISGDAGYYHSGIIIDTDNDNYADTLYMWGDNQYGQIGNGSENGNIAKPILITPKNQEDWNGNIVDLSLDGYNSSVLVDTDNDNYGDTLYVWGDNNSNQINDSENNILFPVISYSSKNNKKGEIIDLDLSYTNTAISVDTNNDGYADTLYIWGDNSEGQIGNGTIGGTISIPTKVTPKEKNNWGGNIVDIALGEYFSSVLIDTDQDNYGDTIYTWGDNSNGQLGNGTTNNSLFPQKITPQGQDNWNGNIIDLEASANNISIIIDDIDSDNYADNLYIWGDNNNGQLGNGTTNNSLFPQRITPQGQDNWNGNIIDLSISLYNSGVLIDQNNDQYADSLYIWGSNKYGQLGNYNLNENRIYFPQLIFNTNNFKLKDFYFGSKNSYLLADLNNDGESDILYGCGDNSNYQLTNYYDNSNLKEFSSIFSIFPSSDSDYLISNYQILNQSQEDVTILLDFSQNGEEFNLLDYTSSERKIKVNYTDLDQNISNSQEFVIDDSYEITLTDLNSETNYQIDSIQYFYENGEYKYTIDQDPMYFQTEKTTPIIKENSIFIIENSITTTSFEFNIEIDNLKPNENETNFTQYDVNNGIWLIDQNENIYNSSFVTLNVISNGVINGTQNYQLEFLQNNLDTNTQYVFSKISLNDPNDPNSEIITLSNSLEIKTLSVNKQFVENSFVINETSITTNLLIYEITIDNLIYSDEQNREPIFLNFNLNENLYLKDSEGNIYSSTYVLKSSVHISSGTERGTEKYKFFFEIENLESNKNYNFENLSFTKNFDQSLDISENGNVNTKKQDRNFWILFFIVGFLIAFILITTILFWINLKLKEKIIENENKINDFQN
ncbi:RCC1 domain-containing protein [Candidatus Hepatoplasma crinochetorum]|uniref:RCC1 domain-containing protein n=1 Tax=Candidatus Hepatoplasma crinochetorum TaxID=295596 RepID=UPI0030891437|nr:MAG: hypothetical protein HCTKY_5500 [Candidatus Hepatoplasma crinochetorum]